MPVALVAKDARIGRRKNLLQRQKPKQMTTIIETETETDWLLALFDASEVSALTATIVPIAPSTVKNSTCNRCSGTGRIPNFSHVKGGECFRCRGTGRGN